MRAENIQFVGKQVKNLLKILQVDKPVKGEAAVFLI